MRRYMSGTDLKSYRPPSFIAIFRQYHLSSSGNKQHKNKNEVHYFIWITDDIDQFDRLKERKENFLAHSFSEWHINLN